MRPSTPVHPPSSILGRLLFLFIAVPVLELALLFFIGQYTGLKFTLALVLLTGFVGAWLARQQGWRVLRRIQEQVQQGEAPAESLFDGLMIFLAGALLITPGVLTDLVGFFLLLPPGRALVKRRVVRWLLNQVHVRMAQGVRPSSPSFSQRDEIIDVQFEQSEKNEEGSDSQ